MPYQVSLLRNTLTDILFSANSLPIKVGIRYSAFIGSTGTSSLKNSTKPVSKVSRNAGVNPHIFIETNDSISNAVPFDSAPSVVLIIFLVSTTSVRLFCSSILQIPRVTPPLSDKVFFNTKPAIHDCPPFTKYS